MTLPLGFYQKMRRIRGGSAGHSRAGEIADAVLHPVVFSTLGVVPFNAEPGSRRAMDRSNELDCPYVPREKHTRAGLWGAGGHRCPGVFP